jgi:hypothetical protein
VGANKELPSITCESDWLDLREGETGKVTGKLHSALKPGDGSVMVTLADWPPLLISLPKGCPDGVQINEGVHVEVIVTRNEDGVESEVESIRIVR